MHFYQRTSSRLWNCFPRLNKSKESCLQDSRAGARPLAAIFLLREVRILPGGLFII